MDFWEKEIIALPVASNLASQAMLKILRKATGSSRHGYYLGLIDMVLREAAILSLEKGQMKIDSKTLAEVVSEYG